MTTSRRSLGKRVRSDFFHNGTGVLAQADPEKIFGDDWEATEYVKPSIHRAKADASSKKLHQGRGSFCNVDLTTTGPGVFLYFKLLERGMMFFVIATLISLPSLYFMLGTMQQKSKALSGQQILDDPLKLSQLSLGSLNGNTSVPLPWAPYQLVEPPTIGLLITFVDLFVVLSFLFLVYVFGRDIENSTSEIENNGDNDRNVCVTDFAVYVTGLPPDVHTKDVHEFFSDLYQLSEPDWSFDGYCGCLRLLSKASRNRSDQEDRGVIMTEDSDSDDDDNEEAEDEYEESPIFMTTNPTYEIVDHTSEHNPSASKVTKARDTWVSETTLVRSDGAMIRHFMSMKALVRKSMKQRAQIKQHRANAALKDVDTQRVRRAASMKKVRRARKKLEISKKVYSIII